MGTTLFSPPQIKLLSSQLRGKAITIKQAKSIQNSEDRHAIASVANATADALDNINGSLVKVIGSLNNASAAVAAPSLSYASATVAGTYSPALSMGRNVFELFLAGNATINAPAGGQAGDELEFIIIQNTPGGFTLAWDAAYRGLGNYDIDTTVSTYSAFGFTIRLDGKALLKNRPVTGVAY